jgi:hypothetical protein
MMKIAIHNRPGSFSDRWIIFCQENNIPYKSVNCYSSDIIRQIKDCDGLMWHWSHYDYRDQNFARQLIFSIEKMGIKVFPNFDTCWHYDDKVGQKYLLEAINAPLVLSYTFYDKDEAIKWIDNTQFPKVFKLRGGAGSSNVKLIKNSKAAKRIVRKAFGKGFPLFDKYSGFKQRLWVLRRDKNIKAIIHVIKGLIRLVNPLERISLLPCQKGYVYFQDFIPNNDFDDRVVIIGNKAIAIRRYNRDGDFRASGSGLIKHNSDLFDSKTIKIAFEVTDQIGAKSLAFDFVYDEIGDPIIIEISYAYAMGAAYDDCLGYWDKDLNWHEDDVNPQRYIIEDFINSLE